MKYLLMVVLLCTVTQVWAAAQGGKVVIDMYATGDRLLVWCDGYIDAVRNGKSQGLHGNCAGYIAGIVDAHNAYVGWGDMKANFCMPDDVLFGQVVRVVTKRLKEYPENLHLVASSTVTNALSAAFPCE